MNEKDEGIAPCAALSDLVFPEQSHLAEAFMDVGANSSPLRSVLDNGVLPLRT